MPIKRKPLFKLYKLLSLYTTVPTKKQYCDARFEICTAVKVLIAVLWIVTPCSLVGVYLHFGGTYLQVTRRREVPPKLW
jgi:hypothetical protein